jgi:hypothetical protein
MADTSSKVDEVENIRVDHLLRWLKQRALRGKARQFDETGQCAAQKLVLTATGCSSLNTDSDCSQALASPTYLEAL